MDDYKHGEGNIEVQENTFAGFIKMVSWGAGISVGILIFLAIFNT